MRTYMTAAARAKLPDTMPQSEIPKHLLMMARQQGDEAVDRTKEQLRRSVPFWSIALDLGGSGALVYALGGPKI